MIRSGKYLGIVGTEYSRGEYLKKAKYFSKELMDTFICDSEVTVVHEGASRWGEKAVLYKGTPCTWEGSSIHAAEDGMRMMTRDGVAEVVDGAWQILPREQSRAAEELYNRLHEPHHFAQETEAWRRLSGYLEGMDFNFQPVVRYFVQEAELPEHDEELVILDERYTALLSKNELIGFVVRRRNSNNSSDWMVPVTEVLLNLWKTANFK